MKRTDPALTPEQRRAKAEEEARAAAARQGARARRPPRPRAAVRRTRRKARSTSRASARCHTIEQQIQSSIGVQRRSSTSARSSSRRGRRRQGDKPVPPVLERELANIDAELAQAGRARRRQAEGSHARQRALRRRQEALARAARRHRGADERHAPSCRAADRPQPRPPGAQPPEPCRAEPRCASSQHERRTSPDRDRAACDNGGLRGHPRADGRPWLNTFTR